MTKDAPDDRSCEGLHAMYITYDGLLEPLGESQVLSYVLALARRGVRLVVLSFEKADDLADQSRVADVADRLQREGVRWCPRRYHRRPRALATLWDIAAGTAAAWHLVRRHQIALIHARSYVASVMALALKVFSNTRFLFDMRGFWPEERVELGLFRPDGELYRVSKRFERAFLNRADHVVVLTERAKAILREQEAASQLAGAKVKHKDISVIPCCVDLDRFQPNDIEASLATRHGLDDKLVIGNLGAVNDRYMLREMFRFAYYVKSHLPQLQFVYLSRHPEERIRPYAKSAGLRDQDLLVTRVEPHEVPAWLSLFRLGVFFLRPSYAAKASSYTKLGELLASGVPVVTNAGVGDVERILSSCPGAIIVPGLTERDLSKAASQAVQALNLADGATVAPALRTACRNVAEKHFSLENGVDRYFLIYQALLDKAVHGEVGPVATEVGH